MSTVIDATQTCRVPRWRPDAKWKQTPDGIVWRCSACEEWLPQSAFGLRKKSGLPRSRCKSCKSDDRRVSWKKAKFRTPLHLLRFVWWRASARARTSDDVAHTSKSEFVSFGHVVSLYRQQNGRCYWTGMRLTAISGDRVSTNISMDRVDPRKGYVEGNVVLACWMVNFMKNGYTPEEFVGVCEAVARKHGTTAGA